MSDDEVLQSLPAAIVPADLQNTPASSMPDSTLGETLHLVERIFLHGYGDPESLTIHGYIHADRAGRISMATLAGALGARPIMPHGPHRQSRAPGLIIDTASGASAGLPELTQVSKTLP